MTESGDILDRIAVDAAELQSYGAGDDLASRSRALLAQQKTSWEMARTGYASLDAVRARDLRYDGFTVRLQFNPGRMVSSTAKVDAQSIRERKCFLCPAHLPLQQKGIPYGKYLVLCNPFPIFPEHFTLTNVEHEKQEIRNSFPDLLAFARLLAPLYTVFYNGPRCGASAPDHLHFQAGTRGFMPIDGEYLGIRDSRGTLVNSAENVRIYRIRKYLRPCIAMESSDDGALAREFGRFYDSVARLVPSDDEPMMNIIVLFESGSWRVLLFPRRLHRPASYFAEGAEKILISPGAVDLGGVCIMPREEDFLKLTERDVEQIFDEVMLDNSIVESVFR